MARVGIVVKINGEALRDELESRGIDRNALSETLGFGRYYINSACNRGKIGKSATVSLDKLYGIDPSIYVIDDEVIPVKKEEPKDIIDYDRLYEVVKNAMLDALAGE